MGASVTILMVFILLVAGILFAYLVKTESRRIIRQRIKEQYIKPPTAATSASRRTESSGVLPLGRGRPDLFPTITRYLRGTAIADKLRMDLLRANLFLRPSEYIAIIIGSALMLFLLGRIFIANVWLLLGLAALGGFLPQLYVKNLQQRRLMALERQIPDALMLISASLRTGYSFLRAVQMVVDQMPPPISEEFARIVHDSNLGAPMEDALRHLVARVRSYNLELVVTAVLIQLETGGNLSEILENIAETIRERARIINEIRILTQEGKLSGILVGILPVAMGILLSIMNPSYMKPLVTTPMGKMMLGLGLGLQVLGALVIKKMIAIDV